MATIKEWKRDFKRKPKWDQFCIIFTVIVSILGLLFGGKILINKIDLDIPTFYMQNSSNIGVIYKSPYSVISIESTSAPSDSCDPNRYKHVIRVNLTNFFEKTQCGDNPFIQTPNLRYDLYNVRFVLPTKQEVLVPEISAGESYIIAYMNGDYSDACIPHKYRILSSFDKGDVCFESIVEGKVCEGKISLGQGPLFKKNKTVCYKMLSGDSDVLGMWPTS